MLIIESIFPLSRLTYIIHEMLTKRYYSQPLVNLDKTALRRESKLQVCQAIAYRFLHLWYKYEVKKFSYFVRFTFRVIKVYQNPTGTTCTLVYSAKSKYDIMNILSEICIYATNAGIWHSPIFDSLPRADFFYKFSSGWAFDRLCGVGNIPSNERGGGF